MRILGLDIGKKSCGIAISDELNITAQGKENFRFDEKDWDSLINKIIKYLEEYEINTIVIGYPTYPSGDKSETTLMVEEVESLIKNTINIKVIRIDEYGTTKRAHEIMIKAGLTRKKRKAYKDKIAAQLILEDYLARL
ncbi:Holliday junction resolvase RuvX [Candidatus Mycoplasma mahonii]|uniref:Holliday junction resolvase RuvX n=1 Tax=Candidatus Mycoplasma mahonii TaxID=3004105 RepID=UPI0026ED99BF|nr:Holliday junction resolvase RuvX [Candidatus Mycoplasma mahonii]WKX02314.1 Holliday junction resolvase RuvX [Candidatus Mycoplasma mahonii]